MKKILFAILLLVVAPCVAYGADIAVRPSTDCIDEGNHDGNGLSWACAASAGGLGARKGFPTTLVRGNNYFLADGTYATAMIINTPVSGNTYINIQKATVSTIGVGGSAHGPSGGWTDSLGDGVATFTGTSQYTTHTLEISTNYIRFDGVVGGGPGSWATGHGFVFTNTTVNHQIMLSCSYCGESGRVDVNNVELSHIELNGGPEITSWTSADNRTLFCATTQNANIADINLSYMYFHDCGGGFIGMGQGADQIVDRVKIEKSYFLRNASSNAHHGSGVRMDDVDDVTIRYNWFRDIVGTGVVGFYTGQERNVNNDVKIYGNVFSYTQNGPHYNGDCNEVGGTHSSGNGHIYGITSTGCGGVTNGKIYNNSFVNIENFSLVHFPCTEHASSNIDIKNNIFYLIAPNYSYAPGFDTTATLGYNYYSSVNATDPAGFHVAETDNRQNAGTTNPFTSWTTGDFSLVSNTTAGTNLGSPYNVDPAGVTRTTWSRGAYEYGAGSTPPSATGCTISGGTFQ